MTKDEAIKVLKRLLPVNHIDDVRTAIDMAIESLSADVVPKGVLNQFRWERDVAMMQLEEYGIPFLTNKDEDIVKVVRCKDCKWYKACKVFSNNAWHDDDFCAYGERREQCD